jgi:hypothetical protein
MSLLAYLRSHGRPHWRLLSGAHLPRALPNAMRQIGLDSSARNAATMAVPAGGALTSLPWRVLADLKAAHQEGADSALSIIRYGLSY